MPRTLLYAAAFCRKLRQLSAPATWRGRSRGRGAAMRVSPKRQAGEDTGRHRRRQRILLKLFHIRSWGEARNRFTRHKVASIKGHTGRERWLRKRRIWGSSTEHSLHNISLLCTPICNCISHFLTHDICDYLCNQCNNTQGDRQDVGWQEGGGWHWQQHAPVKPERVGAGPHQGSLAKGPQGAPSAPTAPQDRSGLDTAVISKSKRNKKCKTLWRRLWHNPVVALE